MLLRKEHWLSLRRYVIVIVIYIYSHNELKAGSRKGEIYPIIQGWPCCGCGLWVVASTYSFIKSQSPVNPKLSAMIFWLPRCQLSGRHTDRQITNCKFAKTCRNKLANKVCISKHQNFATTLQVKNRIMS